MNSLLRLFFACFLAFILCACAVEPDPRPDLEPQFKRLRPSADFSLTDANGVVRSLADYKNKIVLLNFWASWCMPCVQELPMLNNLYHYLGDEDFVVLGINSSDDRDTLRRIGKEAGVDFPLLHDAESLVSKSYQVSSLPQTFLLDRNGIIVSFPDPLKAVPAERMVGPRDWDSPEMARLLNFMLQER